MLHHTKPALFLLLLAACTRSGDLPHEAEEARAATPTSCAHGELVCAHEAPQDTRGMGAPVDQFHDQGGCQVYAYTTGQFGEGAAPAGYTWNYCVCGDAPANDPLSGPLEGGWTYPMSHCRHDWSNH